MTLLIGANLKHYTILAADTRTSFSHWFWGESHKDRTHKIAMCNFGLITGSGYVNALDSVKKELLSKDITHTDEFLEVVEKFAVPEIENLIRENPGIKHNTCFLLSYRTILDDERKLRLSLIHPKWNYQLGIYEKAVVVMPTDFNEEKVDKYNNLLNEELIFFENNEKYSDVEYAKNLYKNIYKNIQIVAKYFNEISQQSAYVSQDVDVTAYLLNGNYIYTYGETNDLMQGIMKLANIPSSHQTRFLTPDIFKEGKKIDIN